MGALEERWPSSRAARAASAPPSRPCSRARGPAWRCTAATRRRCGRCATRIAAGGRNGGGVRGRPDDAGRRRGVAGGGRGGLGPVDVLVANAGGSPVRPGPGRGAERGGLAPLGGREPDRDLPDDPQLPPGDEGARRRRHRHDVLRRGPPADPLLPDRLRRREGGDRAAHEGRRGAGRALRRAGELPGARDDPDRAQPPADPAGGAARPRRAHPIRRLGTPDDVARAALFLAGEDAAWITGVVLDVAGGAVLA